MRRRQPLGAIAAVIATLGFSAAGCGSDAGNWTPTAGVSPQEMYSGVWVVAADDVWAAANGTLKHFDGAAWSEVTVDPPVAVVSFYGFGPDDIWAAGSGGMLRYDGTSWRAVEAPHNGVHRLWGTSSTDMWALDDFQALAYHWDGSAWKTHRGFDPQLYDIWGSGADDIYVVGVFGVYHWAGQEWTKLERNDRIDGNAIWGSSADDVWIVRDGDELAHFDGTDWTIVEGPTHSTLSDIWGRGPNDIWAIGNPPVIVHYDGSEWSSQDAGEQVLTAIHGNADTAFAVGHGVVLQDLR